MKKREKFLLQILLCIALLALIWMFFLEPALAQREALKVDQQIAETQRQNMDTLLASKDLNAKRAKEVEQADKNYQFFYSVLNSYTIDEILNSLAVQHGLNIQSIQIGEYEEATDDFVQKKADTSEEINTEAEETEDTKKTANLLKCQAEIVVTGNYDNILAFVDGMNAKSSCLKTESLDIRQNQQDASGSYANMAQIQVIVYGVNKIEEK